MAKFVYLGRETGPAKTHIEFRARTAEERLSGVEGRYDFERNGPPVEVPDRLAERLRVNGYFAEAKATMPAVADVFDGPLAPAKVSMEVSGGGTDESPTPKPRAKSPRRASSRRKPVRRRRSAS